MLAAANAVCSAEDIVQLFQNFPAFYHVFSISTCRALFSVGLSMDFVCCLLETHIAFGLACAYWRQLRTLRVLNQSLVLTWALGIALGVAQALKTVVSYEGLCYPEKYTLVNTIAGGIASICFAASLFAYGASALRVVRYPESVQQEVWRLCWAYPCAFFVSRGPLTLFQFFHVSGREVRLELLRIALVLKTLNGVLNVIVYALSSHFAKMRYVEVLSSHLVAEDDGIGAGGRDMFADGRGAGFRTEALKEFISFHVGFGETDSIQFIVSPQRSLRSNMDIHSDLSQEEVSMHTVPCPPLSQEEISM